MIIDEYVFDYFREKLKEKLEDYYEEIHQLKHTDPSQQLLESSLLMQFDEFVQYISQLYNGPPNHRHQSIKDQNII